MSTILGPAGVRTLRRALARFFADTVVIRRATDSATEPDGAGGRKPLAGSGWEDVATVNGLLLSSRLTPREQPIANQVIAPVTFEIYLPDDADVRSQDRLVIEGRTFEVQGVSKMAAWRLMQCAFCTELQK